MNKLRIRFGEPAHHWLPVQLTGQDFELEFIASSIPTEPINHLIEALLLVADGVDAEVTWYLEPLCYRFEFAVTPAGITLLINEKLTGLAAEKVYQLAGTFPEIILPFWRAIKARFANKQLAPGHWPVVSTARLQKLDGTMKARRLR